jgi:hypothetical protein
MKMPSDQTLAAGEMENRFREAADRLRDHISVTHHGEGSAPIAIVHLIGRSLSDLRWGQCLASSGYPIQMYSLIRPVREALNLIELFIQKPGRAQDWVDGKHWELTPKKVRDELGIDKDPIYSWMAEHSHPRFVGLQLTTYKVRREGETEWKNLMYLDELPLELPPALIATTMPGLALMDLAAAAGHVPVRATPEEGVLVWATMLRQVAEALEPGFKAVWSAAEPDELEEDEVGEKLREALDATLRHARELEQIAHEVSQKPGDPEES